MTSDVARLAIFAITYALVSLKEVPFFKLTRPATALLGAVAMIILGRFPLRQAYAAIDADVLVFLVGVMLLTAHLEIGGFFDSAAAWLARRFTTQHAPLAAVVAVSGVLSAFFMNDTMCLVLTPVVLAALRPSGARPLPFLLAIALASNVGSAMAITGNPQNMLIGVSSGIAFGRFLEALVLPSMGGLVIVYGVIAFVCRNDLAAASVQVQVRSGTADVPRTEPIAIAPEHEFDRALVTKSLIVFAGALVGWLSGASLPLVAIAAGAILLGIARRDPTPALQRVEWPLIVFFASLFVVTAAIQNTAPVLGLSALAIRQVNGGPWREASVVSAAMLVLSNVVSNVPAVLLWIPVVPKLPDPRFVWLVMAMSSTFAGNLTLLGSVANLIVAERARGKGASMGFVEYLKAGVPVTLLTLAWGIAMLVLFH
ncbi:MAG: SLC13 family permease [Gemmatimonadaceae bacterium]